MEGSGRSDADMAKAFSRYTLLFQQSLNINVPCNINLRAGDIIRVEIPVSGPLQSEKQKELDEKMKKFLEKGGKVEKLAPGAAYNLGSMEKSGKPHWTDRELKDQAKKKTE